MVEHRESYSFHQLDMVEHYAQKEGWEFYRVTDEELALAIEGKSRFHTIKLVWFPKSETLILQCTVHMEPPLHLLNDFLHLVNQCNRITAQGKFTFIREEFYLTYQTHLLLVGEKLPTHQQICVLVQSIIGSMDTFMPAFTALATSQATIGQALQKYLPKRNKDQT